MEKLKELWARFLELPFKVELYIVLAAGIVLGRLGAPWII